MSFTKLEDKPNFPEIEHKVMKFWEKNKILTKYLCKNKDSLKRFSFFDGPITANNPMGVHHARGRSLKDFYQRFKNMQGYKQRFQNGFDCQGLWVEVEVEKALGFNSKKDIKKFGLGNFTKACINRVNKFAKIQTEQSKRLGYFMDWDNSYYTMSENNNLYIWQFLKICYERNLLYKSKSASVWCPRCETGLSKHEQIDGYKDIKDTSLYVKFQIKDRKNEYFLAWTTTAWTIPANVLLAVNPEYQYVKASVDNEVFYLAKDSAERLGMKNYSLINIKDFLGLGYKTPYDHISAQKGIEHFVIEWKMVDPKEGTGIVHIAPGCGEEDFEIGKKMNSSVLSPIDEKGYFMAGYGDLTGKYAHNVQQIVIDFLKSKNLLYKTEVITHSYPHCWRCKTKCLFRVEDNWFIKLKELKPLLKKTAKKANWIPPFVGKRMQDWLENMGGWMISRKRFYGLALPFYECPKCGRLTVVGSKKELRSLAVDPVMVDSLPSLHRPWIDRVEIKCPYCGEIVKRVTDVGDCWLDAGVVPFSTLKYLEDKSYWKKWFPADLISEMTEQVRLWYYSMLVYGVIFEKQIPYINVLNYNEVRDEKGERMSKTKKNGIPYNEAVEKMGADVMRWLYLRKNPSIALNFGYAPAEEIKKQFLFVLWNCYKFFVNYIVLDPDMREDIDLNAYGGKENILDKWILSRLNQLVQLTTDRFNAFDNSTGVLAIENFIVNDLSTWYIRRSRARISQSNADKADKLNCYSTFYQIFLVLTKLLAPIIPFLSEKFWYHLGQEESVHLKDWPIFKEDMIDTVLDQEMDVIRKICSLGNAMRKKSDIKNRQVLSSFYFSVSGFQFKNLEHLKFLIKDELNIKDVRIMDEIKDREGWVLMEQDEIKAILDIRINSELEEQGLSREIIRQIQKMRKEAGFQPIHEILVYYSSDDFLNNILSKKKNRDMITKKVIARDILLRKEKKGSFDIEKHIEIARHPVWIALKKESD